MTAQRPPPKTAKSPAQLRREKRLAEALRANLRRRKTADFSGLAARDERPSVIREEPSTDEESDDRGPEGAGSGP
jgi:hypothetical protein